MDDLQVKIYNKIIEWYESDYMPTEQETAFYSEGFLTACLMFDVITPDDYIKILTTIFRAIAFHQN